MTTTFKYDAGNNLKTKISNDLSITYFSYDELDRLTGQSDKNGTISWTLDQVGNPTKVLYTPDSGRGFKETYAYNQDRQKISHTSKEGITTRWKYTEAGRIRAITYSNGNEQSFRYDSSGRLSQTNFGAGATSIKYDGSNLSELQHANGVTSSYTYTNRGMTERISHNLSGASLLEIQYDYDLNDNRSSQIKTENGETLITGYNYDLADRLTQVTYPAAYGQPERTVTYTYDDANNRATETTASASSTDTKTYTYNSLDQLTDITSTLPDAPQVSYTYDDLGNVASRTVTTGTDTSVTGYLFDTRNQLRQVTTGGSTVGQFLYDHSGQRIESTFTYHSQTDQNQAPATSETKHSLYDGIQLLAEYQLNAEGNPTLDATYQFYQGTLLGRRALSEDDPANNTQTYYHTDAQNSVLATSKLDGTLAARYDYDAWGKELHNTGTSDNPLGYTGHQMDRDIGLIYANARYLDPDTGRFLSFDPFAGYDDKRISLHRYLYAYQNPLRYVDPDGREAAEKFAIDAGRQAIIQSSGHMTTISAAEAANAASYSAAATWGSRALVLLSTGATPIMGLVYSPRLADGTVSPEDQARYMREAEIQRVYEQRERERFLLNNPDLLTDARSSRFGSVTTNRQIPVIRQVMEDSGSTENRTVPLLPPPKYETPEHPSHPIESFVVGSEGMILEQVIDRNRQLTPDGRVKAGGFLADPDSIVNETYARTELAVTEGMKQQMTDVAKFKVPKGVRLQKSVVAPQYDSSGNVAKDSQGREATGGKASQYEILNFEDRKSLELIDLRKLDQE